MAQDNRIPEGVVPPPVKPPVPGSVLSEVSPISDVAWEPNEQSLSRMSQRLGDLEYRVELEPELATTPLGQLAYWDIREKSGGDVSKYIKSIMGNPERDPIYVMGDDPEDPMYQTNRRGRFWTKTGILRVNTTDLVDKFGPEARKLLEQWGADRAAAHELGHAGVKLLTDAGKLPPGADHFAEEDVMMVLDAIGFATREGDVSPPWEMGDLNLNILKRGPIGKALRKDSEGYRTVVDYARTATGVMSGELNKLNPYEQELAKYIIDLNQVASEELASRKQTSYRDRLNREAAKQLTEKGVSTEYPAPLSSNSLAAIDKYMEGSPEPVSEPREQEPVSEPRRLQYPALPPYQPEVRPGIHRFENPEEDGGYIHLDKPDILIFNNPDAGEFIYLNVNTGEDVTNEITGVQRAAGGFIDRPLYDRNPYG
jgi:hypothetical protein